MPESFSSLGSCGKCKSAIALDGLSDSDVVVCPECGAELTVESAKYRFKRKYVDRKNLKVASGVFQVALLAASIAGAMYGIVIPPPPISEDTFTPYRLPLMISCRKAEKAGVEADDVYDGKIRLAPNVHDSLYDAYSSRKIHFGPSLVSVSSNTYESPYSVKIEDDDYLAELEEVYYSDHVSIESINAALYHGEIFT